MDTNRMPLEGWIKVWIYSLLGCLVVLVGQAGGARPRFDTSTDMGLVLVPADAEVDSVIFRLRATDQDADFPLIFDITATVTPMVRIENLPCTLYNKICQANVILTRRLTPGRLHDFAVRVKDSKGDSNSMQATISVTNATTQRDKIFPHIPAIIMVPEDAKPGKELDYILVRSNQWSGKPVYIELWQPKDLFTIRQRQTPAETRGVITLIGELDFETQSMYTLTMYATDPYNEPKKDTRNIAGLHLVLVVQDVQDVPPIFTHAPPLTKINNTVQPGDVILRVHAEDGDKGVPREVTYGLVSEGNPFTPFFNISETTGEIILARPLEELTQITHVGAPVVLSVVAEEIRRSMMEPPAQATVVEVGLLLGEPGNSPPFFENDNYVAWMDENAEPGSVITFTEHYSTKVRDEDIGKAGVFALKLNNNNGTFEISPNVAERTAKFVITVRDNTLIDYESYKSLRFKIIAQEVGPATNLSATVPATIFLRDVNDNAPEFEVPTYEVTVSENVTAGTRIVQVYATDKDTGSFGRIQYTRVIGPGNEAFVIDPDTGIITVAMGTLALDREITPSLELSVEARDEDGKGLRGTVPLIVNLLDVNDNAPIFEMEMYQFTLNENMTNFTMPAVIKALDADAEPPNNEIRYELVHGNYENKFYLNDITGELFLRKPVNKIRQTRHNPYQNFAKKFKKVFTKVQRTFENMTASSTVAPAMTEHPLNVSGENIIDNVTSDAEEKTLKIRKKREDDNVLFTLTARAYDLGVPHMSSVTYVSVLRGPVAGARIVMFVVPGENLDPTKIAETLAAITGGRVVVLEIRPYTSKDVPRGNGTNVPSLEGGKKSIVVARVEPNIDGTSVVDIEKIRDALAAIGVKVIDGEMTTGSMETPNHNSNTNTNTNTNITTINNEEVTIYKAENRLLFWLLIILGLLMLIALIVLIICCICPGCPFYMAPRKRRVHSSETLIARSDGRPRRHLQRKHARLQEATWEGKKQAWSADPTRRNWQFNRRNHRAVGLASLPGDVRIVDREHEILEKAASLRLRDGHVPVYLTDSMRRPGEERIYIEDVEGLRAQGYGVVDMESLRQHDVERGSDRARQVYIGDEEQRFNEQSKFVRESHFYRDGNAEVLRLVTRGQFEEGLIVHPVHRPQTLVIDHGESGAYRVDGKEILLQRFIEDQKMRHASDGQDLHDSLQDIERHSMESHQRQKETINLQQQHQQQQQQQQKILLIPEQLEKDHREHIEELGPDVQRLIIDHGSFEKTPRYEPKDSQELISSATLLVHAPMPKVLGEKAKEQTPGQNINVQHYSVHDLELARQNALLTRLLLERDGREVGVGAMVDSASYLETQSLPGQVAIATQTDRTTATQTELPNRSRSDNDESEEEARMRKKLKSKKRYADGEPRRIRTLWMKSPIKEEDMQYSTEKRTNILRKKMKDIKDGKRISLEPDVLREISDSLDENGDPPMTARRRDNQDDSNSRDESRNDDENERLEDSSSMELTMQHGRRKDPGMKEARSTADEEFKRKSHQGKRENVVDPTFRILEKEMNSLSKKLSKLAGKKILQSSNGSETDSQEKIKTVVMDSKKIDKKADSQTIETKKPTKVAEITKIKRSKSTPRTTVSESVSTKEQVKVLDEIVVDSKPRQASKYRKSQTISTGSSDFEDALEKPKKQLLQITHLEKQKQMAAKSSHVKFKRQSRVEHKELTKPSLLALHQEASEQKDTSSSASKGSIKSGTSERESMKIKIYNIGTGEGITESVPPSSPSSDNSKDEKLKHKEGLKVDFKKKITAENTEASNKASQEKISIVSPVEYVNDASVAKSAIEIIRENIEAPEMKVKIAPGTVTMQKSDSFDMSVDKKVTDDSISLATPPLKSSENIEQRESIDSIQEDDCTMPKEASHDFLTHERNDSVQMMQAQYVSVTDGAGRIENNTYSSVVMKSEDRGGEEVIREEIPDNIELIDNKCTDAIQKEAIEPIKLKDRKSIDVVQKEVPESTKLKDIENISVERKEELAEPAQLKDNGSANIVEIKEKSELIILEDKGRLSGIQKEELPDPMKLVDQENIGVVRKKEIPESVELEDKKSIDWTQNEEIPESTMLEDEKSSDTLRKEEVPESDKLEDKKSSDAIQKEEISKAVKLEDKKSLDAIQKEVMPESTILENKKSSDAIQNEVVPETVKLVDKKSLYAIQKEEIPESTILEDKKHSDAVQKEEVSESVKLEEKKRSDEIQKENMSESTILGDKKSSDAIRKEEVSESVKLEDKKNSDAIQKEEVTESVKLEDKKSSDAMQKEEMPKSTILGEEKSSDAIRKEEISESLKLEDKKSLDATKTEETPESTILEDKKSSDAVQKEEVPKSVKSEDKKSSDMIQKEEIPESTILEGRKTPDAIRKEEVPESVKLKEKKSSDEIQKEEIPESTILKGRKTPDAIRKEEVPESVKLEENKNSDEIQKEDMPESTILGDKKSLDAIRKEEVSGSVKLEDKKSLDATKKEETPESTILEDKKSSDAVRKEVVPKSVKLEDKKSSDTIQKEEIPESIILKDRKTPDAIRKEEVPESIKLEEKKSSDEIQKEDIPESTILGDKKSSDAIRKEEISESLKLEDKKSLDTTKKEETPESTILKDRKTQDAIRKDEVPESVKLEEKKSSDEIQKEDMSESTILGDKKSSDAIRKEEVSESVKLEGKKSSDEIRKEDMPESVKLVTKKSSNIIQKEETPESTILEDKKSSDAIRKEQVTEPMKLENSDSFEQWKDASKDATNDIEQDIEKRKIVAQQSEDAGTFSDNFDSFCGTDIHPKGSLDTQASGSEFSYETLESDSSEEQITVKRNTDIKDAVEGDDAVKNIDKSKEIVSSEIKTKEDIEKPRISLPKTPTLPQSDDESSDRSSKKAISRTPTPISYGLEQKTNEVEEMNIKIETDDAIDIPSAELDTDTEIPIKDLPDVKKHAAEFIKSPKIKQITSKSVESHIVTIPIVLPLDITFTDKSNEELPAEQSESMPEILVVSPRSISSLEEMNLEMGSQKEFGIADSLFVDAKLLKVYSPSRNKAASDTNEEEPQNKILIEDQKNIVIDVPPVNLLELSRDMLEDADDSDSSEASSKTMLTARPYGTPRHRPISDTDNVKELEASGKKTTNQPIETTENLTPKEVSKKISLGSGEADESIENATRINETLLSEQTVEKMRKNTPDIQIETKPGISAIIIDDTVTLMEDVVKVLPEIRSSTDQVEITQVEMCTEGEPRISTFGENDSKKLEITGAQGGDAKTDAASEKVQQLYQIRQEKLPADADGFDSLPETDKPVKNLDDTKIPKDAQTLPMEIAKTASEARVIKVQGAGTKKAVPSVGKDTKGVVRKKESSRDDVSRGAKKPIMTLLKILSPKKERKIKTLKEESSKIGKQSVVVGQIARSRDSKRQIRPAELQVEEQPDPLSRTSQVRRSWRKVDRTEKDVHQQDKVKPEKTREKVDRTEKDVQQQDKVKPEKTKKALSKSEFDKSVNKTPSETRAIQDKLKDSRVKKVQEKTGKTEKSKKSVVESKTEKALKVAKGEHLDRKKIVKKSEETKKKEIQGIINSLKEEEINVLSTVETKKSVISSPISEKEDEGKEKDVEGPTFSEESKELPGETTSELTNSVSTNVKKESPEHILKINRDKETLVMEYTTTFKEAITTNQKMMTKESSITEELTMTGEATITEERKRKEDPAMAEEITILEKAALPEEKTMPKQTATPEDKTVMRDPALIEETTKSTALSKSPKIHDVPVDIEASDQRDIPVKTLDVTELPKEVMKVPIEIMKGAVGTQILHVQPEVEENTSLASTEKETDAIAEKMEPPRRATSLIDVSGNQAEHLKSEEYKPEGKSTLERATEEDTSTDPSKLNKTSPTKGTIEKTTSPRKVTKHRKESEMVVIESQSRYMEWYKLKREEMERKRQERKDAEEEEEKPKWLRKSTRQRWFKGGPDDKRMFDPKMGETTPRRKKIKPLVNVESEQLKAIVRQGRALRKAQGDKTNEPQIQIFAPKKPPTPLSSIPVDSRCHHHHHLMQHSEYKYEKMPVTSFYLHPPSAPHSSPQLSPQHYESLCHEQYQSVPSNSQFPNEVFDSGIVIQQGGNKLRHQQLLEKKSVFDIAYSEAAPSQLRADSTTPPS